MVGGIGLGAAARTWPFRVYSFPSEINRFSELLEPGLRTTFLQHLELNKAPPTYTRIEEVLLMPGGMLLDGDANQICCNNTNVPLLFYRPLYLKGKWECKDGIALIEGTNA